MKSFKFPLILLMLLPLISLVVLFGGVKTRKEFIKDLKEYSTVTSFDMVNQYGQSVDTTIYQNHVSAVQFCSFNDLNSENTNISKQLIDKFRYLQNEFKTENSVQFITVMRDLSVDSVSNLLEYAKEEGIPLSNWILLSGDSPYIDDVYSSSFDLSSNEAFSKLDRESSVYIVDKYRVIRNAYDGTSDESIRKLAEHIALTTPESKKNDIRYVPEKVK